MDVDDESDASEDLLDPQVKESLVAQVVLPPKVTLSAKDGHLVVNWKEAVIPEILKYPVAYSVALMLSEKRELIQSNITDNKEYKFTKFDPILYHYATVQTLLKIHEKYKPVGNIERSKRNRLCMKLDKNSFIDDSLQLRANKDVFKGYRKAKAPDGTVVTDEVAIKLMSETYFREVKISRKLGKNSVENIVRYQGYGKVKAPGKRIFVVLELCDVNSLWEIVKPGNLNVVTKQNILVHMLRGLQYIHEHDVLHRDLKPQNVLRSLDGRIIKIADFGISKQLEPGMSNASKTFADIGTDGWGSPEHYSGIETRMSTKSDIFSAGLVFCFVLSDGKHAYGDKEYEWKPNIINQVEVTLPCLQCREPKLGADLIMKMLNYTPNERPSADQVLRHPFFWDDYRKLEFIHRVWNYLKIFVRKNPEPHDEVSAQILSDLRNKNTIVTATGSNDWHSKITDEFLRKKAGGKVQPKYVYHCDSVIQLIHFIRNNEEHYDDHEELKNLFEDSIKNIWRYFSLIFPNLLTTIYNIFLSQWPNIQETPHYSKDLGKFFIDQAHYERLNEKNDEIPSKRIKMS